MTDLPQWVEQNLWGKYKQLLVVATDREITYLTSTKGKVTRIERKKEAKIVLQGNDRRKNYIINEGDDVPALVDLGVFTRDGKVVSGMYDKFKQINRFAEILDDVFKNHRGKLTLLDFGCGKSYLTFIVYHYLTKVRNIDAEIIGYDLKADVVANCNALAAKYGYDKLRFAVADVSERWTSGTLTRCCRCTLATRRRTTRCILPSRTTCRIFFPSHAANTKSTIPLSKATEIWTFCSNTALSRNAFARC